jgi:hypothetical protein
MYYVFEYITNVEIYCQNLNMQHATLIQPRTNTVTP